MLIRPKDKTALCDYFKALATSIDVWAYGSRVNGTAHYASDADLVIRTANLQPLPHNEYNKLAENIKESNIPILVDLRDWALLPTIFQKQIEQQ